MCVGIVGLQTGKLWPNIGPVVRAHIPTSHRAVGQPLDRNAEFFIGNPIAVRDVSKVRPCGTALVGKVLSVH